MNGPAAAHVSEGRVARERGDLAGAAAHFRDAARLDPSWPAPHFMLCATLLTAASPEAGTLLDELAARFPDDAAGWEEIGSALLAAGKREAALVCLTRAHRAAPSLSLGLRRGTLLRELGRRDDAVTAFEDAVGLEPRSKRAWFLLGVCRQDRREFVAAAAAYRTVLGLDPHVAEAAVNLGTVLQEVGDLDGARAAYADAVRLRPESFGRIAQAVTAAPRGELWLDLRRFRESLGG